LVEASTLEILDVIGPDAVIAPRQFYGGKFALVNPTIDPMDADAIEVGDRLDAESGPEESGEAVVRRHHRRSSPRRRRRDISAPSRIRSSMLIRLRHTATIPSPP
jgi:hypothetical protein